MMIEKSIYRRYEPAVSAPEGSSGPAWWFAFSSNRLLVMIKGDRAEVPFADDLKDVGMSPVRKQYLGTLDGHPCYSAELEAEAHPPENLEFKDLRQLYNLVEEDIFLLAGRAYQIISWDQTHQFCGRCGTPTQTKSEERAKFCPECGFMSFPRLSPAIIVAVVRDGKLLLAHAKHFRENLYSIIAGFVEPGETFEECVQREVLEEVGIRVKNIRYFGSQPWPFPNSLMIGFTAEYESGEIMVDGVEISDAGWYSADSFPEVPTSMSISGRLIDWFRQLKGDKT